MEAVTLSEARVYVGTYNKYNNGSLFGKWLDLSDYSDKDEFMEACRELHKDDQDLEFMFQDYENIPEALISESWLSEKFFEEDADDLISLFEDEYQAEYKDDEDYAYEIVEQCYDLPEFAKTYFDYSAFARDLFITDYWMDNGFVFRCA